MEMRWIATVDIYTGEEAGDWLRLFHSSAACSPSWREEEKEAGSPHAGATSVPPREGSVLGDFYQLLLQTKFLWSLWQTSQWGSQVC